MADKLKILITDDSKLLRKKLREELEKLDCDVLEAENGKEAIQKPYTSEQIKQAVEQIRRKVEKNHGK